MVQGKNRSAVTVSETMSSVPSDNSADATTIDWPEALDQHRPWMRTVARSRVGEAHAADDVIQEVALVVLEHESRPTDPHKVAPWLYRITLRRTINWRRRQGRQRGLLRRVAERIEIESKREEDPREWVLHKELRGSVTAALRQLSPQDREILLLKYTQDWSYQQLAERLGVSVKTVEYRLLRARKAMRGYLKGFGGEGGIT
jgi:RNA polymerase sigma-70 factor (ECF subfamily)